MTPSRAFRSLLALALVAVLVTAVSGMLRAGESSGANVEDVPVAPGPAAVVLVVDSEDPYAVPVADNVRFALRRARVPFVEHDLADGGRLPLDGTRAVLTVAERLGRIPAPDVARLGAFVEGGGGLAVLHRGTDPRLASLLGVRVSGQPTFSTRAEALRLTTPLMPGGEDIELPASELSPLTLGVDPACEVLAEVGDGRPAAWTCARGEGRTAFWNMATFQDKTFRGLVLQTLALIDPEHVRPLAGWAVVYIDDFPSPASNAEVEPIWSAHGQSPARFYTEQWYPDMVSIADRFRLRYTSTVIYSYNGRTRAPFPVAEWLTGRVQRFGRSTPYSPYIMATDAERSEIALHGYNHEPLRLDVWGERAPMVEALSVARARWLAEDLAPLPTTYVPPMNRIDSVGVAVLRETFPEIETVAGLYFGPEALGQGQEFGPLGWDPDLYALPRGTAGYLLGDAARLQTLTLLHTDGVWSHFVHPDDVYPNADRAASYAALGEPDPAGLGWDGPGGLRERFEDWISFVLRHYPWLDPVTADEAADRMRRFDALSVATESETAEGGRRLTASLSQPGQLFVTWARPDEAIVDVEGGTVVDVWEGPLFSQYTVRAEGRQAALIFRDVPTP